MGPLISVCMPVHNCGNFIEEALNSVINQADSHWARLEIVVFDGGSTDKTQEIVSKLQLTYPKISYIYQADKGGIDADMCSAVMRCSGQYCLLLSGDDRLHDGALDLIFNAINGDADVYLSKHTDCNSSMRRLGCYEIFSKDCPIFLNWADPKKRIAYLSNAINSEPIFSFMSGILIRQKLWASTEIAEKYMSTCWGHVARIFQAAENADVQLQYTSQVWIDKRGGYDSFAGKGLVHRISIAVDNLNSIAEDFYGETSIEAKEIRRMIRSDIFLTYWLNAKARTFATPAIESSTQFARLLARNFKEASGKHLLEFFLIKCTPAWTLHFAKLMMRRIKK